jgi:hypothetical protein
MGVDHCAVFSYGIEIDQKIERALLKNYVDYLGKFKSNVRYVSEAYERDVNAYLFFNDLGISAGEKWSGCTELDDEFINDKHDINIKIMQSHRNVIADFFIGTKFIDEMLKSVPAEIESWKSWCTKVQTPEGFDQAVSEMTDSIPTEFSWNLYRYMA